MNNVPIDKQPEARRKVRERWAKHIIQIKEILENGLNKEVTKYGKSGNAKVDLISATNMLGYAQYYPD